MISVSVVVPVYNAHDYLRRCLDSVCNQTLENIEVICVDDCSTDDSHAILLEYARADPRVKVLRTPKNGGESVARNVALDAATGEYLGFVDNDDEIDLDFYRRLYEEAHGNDADVVKAGVKMVGYDGREFTMNLNNEIRRSGTRYAFLCQWWSAIYRRSIVQDARIRFAEGCPLGGDQLFLNQFLLSSRGLRIVDDVFYHYYRRENSGDSKILSYEKVKSGLGIQVMVLKNSLRLAGVDWPGFETIARYCLQTAFAYVPRCEDRRGTPLCVDAVFEIYGILRKALGAESDCCGDWFLPIMLDFLRHDDRAGMVQCIRTNNTAAKLVVANLRYLFRSEDGRKP